MVKLGKYSRSVSIIGVGCTPFVNVLDEPYKGLTEGELFGYAAKEAMEDAGVDASKIDFYLLGQAYPQSLSDYMTPNVQMSEWIGMRGKGSATHSEGCCTGYLALDLAVNAVASGKYDMVLSGCVEMCDSIPVEGKPAHMREEAESSKIMRFIDQIADRAYIRNFGSHNILFDIEAAAYAKENNLTAEQIDDIFIAMAQNSRKNSCKNKKALLQTPYEEEAKALGFDNVKDYLKSPMNPHISQYLRFSGFEQRCSGAAALIVCPTEMAYKYTDKPIEVLAIGNSVKEYLNPHLEKLCTIEAAQQAYEASGVKPEDIDLFFANDFLVSSHLIAAEAAGYLPKGEGWKYVLDERTAYDGDKPINTNGGRVAFGHAYGASGAADYYEAVKQMRGEAGEHQVKKLPKTVMLRGFGGGQNVTATILRTMEGEEK